LLELRSDSKTSLIIIQNPDDEGEKINFKIDHLLNKNYASDSNLKLKWHNYDSNKITEENYFHNNKNYKNKNNISDIENKSTILSPFDIKHPKLFFQDFSNISNLSLNIDFSNSIQEINNLDNKSFIFNGDFTSEEENRSKKAKIII